MATNTKNYINPTTKKPCTYDEYTKACANAGITPIAQAPTTATGGGTTPLTPEQIAGAGTSGLAEGVEATTTVPSWWTGTPEEYQAYIGTPEHLATLPTRPTAMPTVDMPTFDPGAVSPPAVTPAPPYEISPAQQAFEETFGGIVTDWVEAGGYGIPPETQAQMIQQQTDALKAREQESLRVMRNNMERRGITNSGFIYANEQNIRSNTSVAIAGAIADVQIKSALMKMASFEKAMGAAGQFLGYLSEQSQLQYQPEFATWQAEQLATMQAWQASFDKYKMDLNAAYQTQNTLLQGQLLAEQAEIQHGWDIEMLEMEIEATQQAAAAEGFGNLLGTLLMLPFMF